MKPLLFALCVVFAFGGLSGQTPAWQPSPGHTQLPIWPGAVPDPQPVAGPEVTTLSSGKDGLIAGRPVVGVFNVTRPTMTVYSPQGNNTGAAVVVFPGGGYQGLAIDFAPVENGDLPAPAVGKIHVAPVVTLGPTPALWKKRRFVVTAGAAAFLIVAALEAWRLFSSRPALTGTDVILLASFVNKTGDPIFDNSLDKALEVKLTESPFLSVLPDADVRRTMRTMRHEPSERVTQELGIEICKRQGLKAAVVLATTSSLEGLQAYRTGQTLFRSGKQREAIPFLDPQFCSAYGALGTAYYSVSDDQASRKNFTKAYELKDARLTQEENFQTTALYHSYITGNLERKPLYLFCTSRYIHLEARGSGNPDTPSSQSRIQEAHRNRICRRFSVREKAIARFSKVRAPEGIAGSLMRDSARAEDPSREPDNSMVMKSKDSLGIRDVSAR